jgi:predicted RNase H-like HicB family nuclease
MKYPAAIEIGNTNTAYSVCFPDLEGCFSAGDTYDEALQNASEALEMYLEALAEDNELPPQATSVQDHINNPEYSGWMWALVDIDTEPFMGGAIKKNVTLPKLLLKKIDDAVKESSLYKDRSHFLQVAAARELHI